ncbi:MAG: TRAP transporter substrate-binding protein DctP [Synergistaceae bacterium]|nr:TRAP transporter substrate-binding protein DctP [Synergistaceae bacterium]
MKRFMTLLSAAFIFAYTVSPATAAPLLLRFAGQSPPDHMATKTMNEMAKEINSLTKGRVQIKVYPANQLGNYSLVMEEMMRGTVDMACMSVATDFDPRLEILYTNGFVTGYDSAKKVFTPGAWLPTKLDSFTSQLGVHILGSYIEGFIGIGSVKPVKDPLNPKVDKGVLTRVPNMVVYQLGAKAMGYRPITIPYSDVYQSMQTGVCDAVDGYPTAAAYTILGDVIKNWYATNYSMEYLAFMIGDKSWKKLSAADQKVFRDVAKKYTLKSIDNAKAEDEKYMKLMEKKGIKVHRYSEKQLEPIKKACVATWEEVGKAGTGVELMKEFKKNLGK